MTRLAHRIVAVFLLPGHVRLRDHLAFYLTTHIPAIRSLRSRWAARQGRPGFRASEYDR